jgi:hypothetical protein
MELEKKVKIHQKLGSFFCCSGIVILLIGIIFFYDLYWWFLLAGITVLVLTQIHYTYIFKPLAIKYKEGGYDKT